MTDSMKDAFDFFLARYELQDVSADTITRLEAAFRTGWEAGCTVMAESPKLLQPDKEFYDSVLKVEKLASEGQLFRAEWVDADHLFLTPENNPQSLVPKVLAIRWNGDNINEFKPFGKLIEGPYAFSENMLQGFLIVTLHDGSRTNVNVGEWVIRDSQGNMNTQSKHVEVVDKITLYDGITYELKHMRMEYAGKTAAESLLLHPIDSKPTITRPYAIRWNGDNFGEIASRSELVYGAYGQENAHLEVECLFGRVRVDVGEWVMFSGDEVRSLGANFMKSFDSKIYILKKIDESHIEWVRTSSISRPDRLTDSPIP